MEVSTIYPIFEVGQAVRTRRGGYQGSLGDSIHGVVVNIMNMYGQNRYLVQVPGWTVQPGANTMYWYSEGELERDV